MADRIASTKGGKKGKKISKAQEALDEDDGYDDEEGIKSHTVQVLLQVRNRKWPHATNFNI